MGNYTGEILDMDEETGLVPVLPNSFRRYIQKKFEEAAKISCAAVDRAKELLFRFHEEKKFKPSTVLDTCPHCDGTGFVTK